MALVLDECRLANMSPSHGLTGGSRLSPLAAVRDAKAEAIADEVSAADTEDSVSPDLIRGPLAVQTTTA